MTQTGANFNIPAWPLPGQTTGIVIEPGETVEVLARRLIIDVDFSSSTGWSYDWDAISVWIGPAQVLSSLAVVVMPEATTPASQTFTFQTLSDTYGLTLTNLAQSLQDVPGLLPDPTTLTIKQLPVRTVSDIEAGVLRSTSFAGVVNQASRMLMSGLRLPGLTTENGHVIPDKSNPQPLYDLTGQQFDLAVDSDPAQANTVALNLTVFSNVAWLQFVDSVTSQTGDDLAGLGAKHPALPGLNPGLVAPGALRPGMVLFTGLAEDGLDFTFTNQEILDEAPATGLILNTFPAQPPAPAALPLKGNAPRTYGFENPISLHTAQPLLIPLDSDTPLSGYATLWPFPQSLLNRAVIPASTPYQIYAGNQPGATDDNTRPLLSTTYGSQISFRIRRMDDGFQRYLLMGVDTDQRDLLLALRDEIISKGNGTVARFALSPAPNASNAQGLALIDVTTSCYLIKTNLSTDSQPQPDALIAHALVSTEPVYYADATNDLADFLLLLWEGSVVGGTGYYLGFGQDLPASAADAQGVVSLTMLVITGTQQALAPDKGRPLAPYNNCLLVAPGLDSTIYSLYAEAGDDTDQTEVALTPPGNAGFSLIIDTPSGEGTQSALQDRYSTLVFSCEDTASGYNILPAWTPALPTPDDGTRLSAPERQRLARLQTQKATAASGASVPADDDTPLPYWCFEQVIPFYRFPCESPPELTQGLPDPADDPYWGFGNAQSCPEPTLTFYLSDLLGNHSAPPTVGQGSVSLQVGYTDPLIGLSNWPNLTAFFDVTGTPGQASLVMQFGLKAAALLPTPSQRGDATLSAAQTQQQKYAEIFYQLSQDGIGATLSTSLRFIPDDPGQAIDVGLLWRFAGGAHACAQTATLYQATA